MSVEFHGIPAQESLRLGLSIPSLNGAAGSTQMGWFVADTLPPGPAPDDDKYSLIASSIGPPPGTTNSSRAEIEIQNTPESGIAARFNVVCRAQDSDASSTVSSANNQVRLGVPQHIACTIDYTTRQVLIYLNGVLIASGIASNMTAGNADNTNGKVAAIGSEDEGSLEWFDGKLEDMRQYDRVLSADEILCVYTCQGVDGIVFGLQQRYELQGGPNGSLVSTISPQDSAQQQLNASVLNGTPNYAESITPRFRRRLS